MQPVKQPERPVPENLGIGGSNGRAARPTNPSSRRGKHLKVPQTMSVQRPSLLSEDDGVTTTIPKENVRPQTEEFTETTVAELLNGYHALFANQRSHGKKAKDCSAKPPARALIEHTFHCLQSLQHILTPPYPELFAQVVEPLRKAIFHPKTQDPFCEMLPILEVEEERLRAEDREWKERHSIAKKRHADLSKKYKDDQQAAVTLKEELKDVRSEESEMRRTLQGLRETQEDALKHLDVLRDRVRNAMVDRDRQQGILYDARKKHEKVEGELKLARDTLAAQSFDTRQNMVNPVEVKEVEDEIVELETLLSTWKTKLESLHERRAAAEKEYEGLVEEEGRLRNETAVMLEQHAIIQRSYTPRPDWDTIIDETPELAQALRMEKFADLMIHMKEPLLSSSSSDDEDEDVDDEAWTGGGVGSDEENDEGASSEVAALTAAIARRRRAREKAAIRARQFHKQAKMDQRATHQAHHVHHLHKEHRRALLARRHNTRVNKRLSNAKLQTKAETHELAKAELTELHCELHTTKYLAKVLCSVAEVTRVGIGVTRDMEGASRELGMTTLQDMHTMAKKQLQDVQASYREVKLHRDKERLKKHKSGTHGGGVATHTYPPMGMDKDVPPYLRTLVPVTRKTLGKAKLEQMIETIWDERVMMRLRLDGELPTPVYGQPYDGPPRHYYPNYGRLQPVPESMLPNESTLADFLAWHLTGEYGSHAMAEWGFNVQAACERHLYDADIELFYLCLNGAMSEYVYDDSVRLMHCFKELMTRIDIENAREQHFTGASMHVHYLDLKANLRNFFPLKTKQEYERLDSALMGLVSREDGFLNHGGMFAESVLGSQNDFIEEIRDQHLRSMRDDFIALEIAVDKLGKARSDVSPEKEALVGDIRKVVQRCSGADDATVDKYVRFGVGVAKQSEVRWDHFVSVNKFLKRLWLKGYKRANQYDENCKIELEALRKGQGKITHHLLEEKDTVKNYYQLKAEAGAEGAAQAMRVKTDSENVS